MAGKIFFFSTEQFQSWPGQAIGRAKLCRLVATVSRLRPKLNQLTNHVDVTFADSSIAVFPAAVTALTSAPLLRRTRVRLRLPTSEAQCRAVLPPDVFVSISTAPYRASSCHEILSLKVILAELFCLGRIILPEGPCFNPRTSLQKQLKHLLVTSVCCPCQSVPVKSFNVGVSPSV